MPPTSSFIDQIAQVCHEANAAYCRTLGDFSQPSWDNAPEWQKESARLGVSKILTGEITRPEQSHESWSQQKLADGWKYGPEKNPEKKEHHCLVPFNELPTEQQQKDYIFFAIASSFRR